MQSSLIKRDLLDLGTESDKYTFINLNNLCNRVLLIVYNTFQQFEYEPPCLIDWDLLIWAIWAAESYKRNFMIWTIWATKSYQYLINILNNLSNRVLSILYN